MSVKSLANEIYQNSHGGFEKLSTELLSQIRHYGEEKFLEHLILSYPDLFVQNFMLSHREIWGAFTLDSWRSMLLNLQDNELALYTLISFLSRYLRINSIVLYRNIPGINEQIRKKVLEYFSERPGMLKLHQFEIEKLRERDIKCEGMDNLDE